MRFPGKPAEKPPAKRPTKPARKLSGKPSAKRTDPRRKPPPSPLSLRRPDLLEPSDSTADARRLHPSRRSPSVGALDGMLAIASIGCTPDAPEGAGHTGNRRPLYPSVAKALTSERQRAFGGKSHCSTAAIVARVPARSKTGKGTRFRGSPIGGSQHGQAAWQVGRSIVTAPCVGTSTKKPQTVDSTGLAGDRIGASCVRESSCRSRRIATVREELPAADRARGAGPAILPLDPSHARRHYTAAVANREVPPKHWGCLRHKPLERRPREATTKGRLRPL
jgi:hypothetical protein